jgi:hypothetical protein
MDLMDEVGRQPLRNRHLLLERGGHTLVVAGADDVTADSSGLAGHCAHFAGALDGADPALPVLLLAHQPEFIDRAHRRRPDLAIARPRPSRSALAGFSHHGPRTLLRTTADASAGSGPQVEGPRHGTKPRPTRLAQGTIRAS